MIKHIVLFKFKTDVPAFERESFIARLTRLPELISEIDEFEVGEDVTRAPRSYDLALVSTYADQAALARYVQHPDHLPVVEQAKAICESVVAVDYRFDP